MKKRFFAALLALVVCCMSMGIPASAATDTDLVVTDFYWNNTAEVKPGTELIFSVTVKNEGTSAVTQPVEITFGSAKTTFTSATYSDGIPAGGTVTIQSQPWKAVAGDYMAAVRVNSTGAVAESKTHNNTMQTNLRVAEDKLAPTNTSILSTLKDKGIDSLIFNDDFDTLDAIDTENSGKEGYKWYVKRPYGASTLTSDDYSVTDGVLSIHALKPTYNYGLGTYHPTSKVGFTYTTGYMEIRLRIPRPRENESGESGAPAIWALPTTKLGNQATEWVELDWMEYWGTTSQRPGGYYTICLHEQHLSGSIAENNVGTHYKNSNYMYQGLGDGQWHTMGWLWQNGQFTAYLDGEVVMFLSYSENGMPMPKHNVVKGQDSLGVYSMLDQQLMPIIIGGSKDNPMELDYVRLWNVNEHYTADDAAADAFVKDYTLDANGNPIKNPDGENYTRILSGESAWAALSDAVKEKVNAKLAEKEQPVFTELLTKAKAVEAALNATEPTEPGGSQEKPGSQVIVYVAIAAGVLVIVGVVLGVILKKRKK